MRSLALALWLAFPFADKSVAPSSAPAAMQAVDVAERLGAVVPANLQFVDAAGRHVRLGDVISDDRPTLLVLAYYECPMLCGLSLRSLADGLAKLDLSLGRDYRAVTVSFDPRDGPDDASRIQASVLSRLKQSNGEEAWPFLVGQKPAIDEVTRSVGFQYAFDEHTGQYAHPAVVFVLAPGGKLVRYLYGINLAPRDLKLALLEPSAGRSGDVFDRVLMTCFRWDPALRRYGPAIQTFYRIGGIFILAIVTALLAFLWRLEKKRRQA